MASAAEPQPVHYPRLPEAAGSAEAFAPPGWRVETQARGDLDGDRAPDLAFVLTAEDAPPLAGRAEPDPNPRMLAVAFAAPGGGYRLHLRNTAFLPRKRRPNGLSQGYMLFGDGSVSVVNGRLRILFEYTRGHRTFTFAWRAGELRLIGYDSASVDGGCLRQSSINFLTGRAKLSAGWVDRNEARPRWMKLPRQALLSLAEMGEGEELDPHKLDMNFPLACPGRT